MSKIYTIIEQHVDGSWWYHPLYSNYKSKKEAEENAIQDWNDRKWRIICHKNNFPYCSFYYRFIKINNSMHRTFFESCNNVNSRFRYIRNLFKINIFF